MKLIATLIAGGILTGTAALTVIDVVGTASETVAASSIATVVRAAQAEIGVHTGEMPWAVALTAAAASLSQGADAITVDGHTVRWALDGECYEATVPGEWSPVEVVSC
jgi:hypothetical protein